MLFLFSKQLIKLHRATLSLSEKNCLCQDECITRLQRTLMIKLFSASSNYLPSRRSTWADRIHAKKCVLSSGLTVDGWIIHKQPRTNYGVYLDSFYSCAGSLYAYTVFISFDIWHIFQRGLYPSRFGQDFLCNMLYNCINKPETIWVGNICIHLKCVIRLTSLPSYSVF